MTKEYKIGEAKNNTKYNETRPWGNGKWLITISFLSTFHFAQLTFCSFPYFQQPTQLSSFRTNFIDVSSNWGWPRKFVNSQSWQNTPRKGKKSRNFFNQTAWLVEFWIYTEFCMQCVVQTSAHISIYTPKRARTQCINISLPTKPSINYSVFILRHTIPIHDNNSFFVIVDVLNLNQFIDIDHIWMNMNNECHCCILTLNTIVCCRCWGRLDVYYSYSPVHKWQAHKLDSN